MAPESYQSQTTPGFQPPVNVQFSVFLDNRVGKLLELLGAFDNQALTVAALSVVDSTDHAVVRILTSSHGLARRLLQRKNLPFAETDVIVVELPTPQSFAQVCSNLLSAELNIHYAYPLMVQPRNHPAIVLNVDDYVLSTQILRRKLFTILAENDLGENAPGSDPLSNFNN